jgi:hypothetical protein
MVSRAQRGKQWQHFTTHCSLYEPGNSQERVKLMCISYMPRVTRNAFHFYCWRYNLTPSEGITELIEFALEGQEDD